jgi:hypothetical protein
VKLEGQIGGCYDTADSVVRMPNQRVVMSVNGFDGSEQRCVEIENMSRIRTVSNLGDRDPETLAARSLSIGMRQSAIEFSE